MGTHVGTPSNYRVEPTGLVEGGNRGRRCAGGSRARRYRRQEADDRSPPRKMYFELIGPIRQIETIAVRHSIRDRARLRRLYGHGRWRKRKGIAMVRLADGFVCEAEVHWYEATGIGRRELRVKRLLT